MKKIQIMFLWEVLMLFFKLFIYILFSINIFADSLAVIVSKDSTIDIITKKELSKIFLVKTKRLPNGEKSIVIESTNKEYQSKFYKSISSKNEKQLKKYWAKMIFTGRGQPPKKMNSINELILFIKNNKNAISYIPFNYVNSDVKTVMEIK